MVNSAVSKKFVSVPKCPRWKGGWSAFAREYRVDGIDDRSVSVGVRRRVALGGRLGWFVSEVSESVAPTVRNSPPSLTRADSLFCFEFIKSARATLRRDCAIAILFICIV